MSESDEIAVRLTVLETVVRQLITHMAVRDDDPASWVQTRKTLAMRALTAEAPWAATALHRATEAFFDLPETVAQDYEGIHHAGTARPPMR